MQSPHNARSIGSKNQHNQTSRYPKRIFHNLNVVPQRCPNWTMAGVSTILENAEVIKQQGGNHIDAGHHRHGCVLNSRVRWLCHGNSTAGCRPEGNSRRCESRPINLSFRHPGLVECRALHCNAELSWESLPWRETVNSHATIPAFRISLFAGS